MKRGAVTIPLSQPVALGVIATHDGLMCSADHIAVHMSQSRRVIAMCTVTHSSPEVSHLTLDVRQTQRELSVSMVSTGTSSHLTYSLTVGVANGDKRTLASIVSLGILW